MSEPVVALLRKGFVNLTPYAAEMLLLQDEHGAEVLTLVIKATFALGVRGGCEPIQPQPPVNPEAIFHGAPGASSLKHESDAVISKKATDIALIGHAYTRSGRLTEVEVSLRVGPLHKRVLVLGDRVWSRSLGASLISPPLSFERMPLTYERAYGGWDRTNKEKPEVELRNPVGTGFIARPSRGATIDGVRLPNLEDCRHRIRNPADRPPPANFGLIASHWEPRLQLAGTYDEAWKRERFPLVPVDFDRCHFNAAPADLQVPGFLSGGEPVEVLNASTRGQLRFHLPTIHLGGVIMLRSERRELQMRLDTIVIDTDEHLLTMIWRCTAPLHRRVHELVWAKVQELGRQGLAV